MPITIINTDWKLEDAGTKTYGMCFVRVSPPYDHLSFKRGFTLPNPTHQRCAAFALILGIELVLDENSFPLQLNDNDPARETEKPMQFVVSTKNKWVYDAVDKHLIDTWENTGRWPKGVLSMRGLLIRLRDVAAELPLGSAVVHIERDSEDKARVDLITKEDDLDMSKNKNGAEGIQKAMQESRMRNVMIQELLASRSRGSRPRKKMSRTDKKTTPIPSKTSKKDTKEDGTGDKGRSDGDRPGEQIRTTEEPGDGAAFPQCDIGGREQLPQDSIGVHPVGNGEQAL